jgi:hypothetical protein
MNVTYKIQAQIDNIQEYRNNIEKLITKVIILFLAIENGNEITITFNRDLTDDEELLLFKG